jgi:hypothetical protein
MTLTSNIVVKSKAFKSGSNRSAEATAPDTVSQLQLARTATGVTRYADNMATGCSSLSNNDYNPATRSCGSGASLVYVGIQALQNAVNASWGGDIIRVRSSGRQYIGSGESNSVTIEQRPGSNVTGQPGAGTPLNLSTALIIEGCPASACGSLEIPSINGIDGLRHAYLRNVKLNANNVNNSLAARNVFHSRLENVEVTGGGLFGILSIGHSELINLNVHENGYNGPGEGCQNGSGHCHGLYTGSCEDDGCNNLIDGGQYWDNSGYGIHCYQHCGPTIIRNTRIYQNGYGLIVSTTPGVKVYNNVVYNNRGGGIISRAPAAEIYNNTIYGNIGNGIRVQEMGGAVVRNNLVIGNTGRPIEDAGITERKSAYSCGGKPCIAQDSNNVTTGSASSYFIDAAKRNFQLIPASKIKGVGADLSRPTRALNEK